MPNPARSQGEFDAFFDRFLHPMRKAGAIKELLDRFRSTDVVVVEHGDVDENTSDWSLSGVQPGVNTDALGRLFVRLVADGGDWDVNLYKATGGGSGDLVASADAVADGATATLSEANGSGISGTVLLSGSVSGVADDIHRLHCLVGYPAHDRAVHDDSDDRDGVLRQLHGEANARIVGLLAQAEAVAAGVARNPAFVEWVSSFVKGDDRSALSKGTNVDDDQVTLSVTGAVEDLREAMDDNTTPQDVDDTTVAAGSPSYDAGNTGAGTLAVGAIKPNVPPGLLILTCINETPPERFRVTLKPDDPFERALVGANDLVVGKAWIDPDIPVSLTLSRTYDKNSTDGTNVQVAASGASIQGLSLTNSDDGVLYGKVVANGSNFNFEFYKSSGLAAGDLVAKATNIATGAAFTATQQNRSGLSISWTAGSAPTNGGTFQLDANPFKVGPPADKISVVLTRSATGQVQEAMRRYFGWYLEQSGSTTISDNVLRRNRKVGEETIL